MKRLAGIIAALAMSLTLAAQQYQALEAKLNEYLAALAGDSPQIQGNECDFLIESASDSLVRQFVTLKLYTHYLESRIMGDEAVAVHIADKWLLSGKVKMHSEEDLMNARIFAEFNRSSLIGKKAPATALYSPDGKLVRLPKADETCVLYFYDIGCPGCKVETPRLAALAESGKFSFTLYAIYVGADGNAWEEYRKALPGAIHLWDPEARQDWQKPYGVLKTPSMFLIGRDGTILGRKLDTPALKMLLERESGVEEYTYGSEASAEGLRQIFASYGDTLKVSHIMDVADYIAARTFTEGSIDSFRQAEGDLLYFLSSSRGEVFHDAAIPFNERYIKGMPEVWESDRDKARVVSLAGFMADMAARTPAGSKIPSIRVPGRLYKKPSFLCKGVRDGNFRLDRLCGGKNYVVFYSAGCGSCGELIARIPEIAAERGTRVLLLDMDAILSNSPELGELLLDSFDLSSLPFVIQTDRKGIIQHRYVEL